VIKPSAHVTTRLRRYIADRSPLVAEADADPRSAVVDKPACDPRLSTASWLPSRPNGSPAWSGPTRPGGSRASSSASAATAPWRRRGGLHPCEAEAVNLFFRPSRWNDRHRDHGAGCRWSLHNSRGAVL